MMMLRTLSAVTLGLVILGEFGCARPDLSRRMMPIDERVATGGQPYEDDFEALAARGYMTVVNLREAGETGETLSPAREAELARAAGMDYVHIPVSSKKMSKEQVAQFCAELAKRDGQVFVHCRTGHRAGAFAMMRKACASGWTGQQTLDEAKKMGFNCDDRPEIRDFVKAYVDGVHQSP